ncbi:MAG: phosphoribosylanthranilate isomerase [Beijerinckiaceae bacterium]
MAAGFLIKICGLSTADTMTAALDAGADMVGLVFHRKSPRSVSLEVAAALAGQARGRARIVALTVDPSDEGLAAIMARVNPDVIQLHGMETPERCAEIEDRTARVSLKAIGISDAADIERVRLYHERGRTVLLDAKPPRGAAYPGGHGNTFDWSILDRMPDDIPFLLSGGLTQANVSDAIHTADRFCLAFAGVDVSSGVESALGVKDSGKIRAFVETTRAARAASWEAIT